MTGIMTGILLKRRFSYYSNLTVWEFSYKISKIIYEILDKNISNNLRSKGKENEKLPYN